MITAEFTDSGASPYRVIKLRTKGHGEKTVCNAVSTLSQTAACYLSKLEQDFPEGLTVKGTMAGDTLSYEAKSVDYQDSRLHVRLDALSEILEISLLSLEAQYPTELKTHILGHL